MIFLTCDIPDSVNNQIDGHACSGLGKADFSKLIMGTEVLIPFKPIKPIRLTQVRHSADDSFATVLMTACFTLPLRLMIHPDFTSTGLRS